MAIPTEFELYLNQGSAELDEVDIDETAPGPIEKFIEEQQLGVGASEAFSKITPPYRPPTGDGNHWVTHSRVTSQKIEAEFEPVGVDDFVKSLAAPSNLTYKTRRDSTGTVWREGFNEADEIKFARIVDDEE